MITCFYAFASNPAIQLIIMEAIESINKQNLPVKVIGWPSEPASGSHILSKVTSGINKAHVFLCDLTEINANVLFELGYAIATEKPIWITIDDSLYEEEALYKE